MARSKQNARKQTAGKSTRKQPAKKAARANVADGHARSHARLRELARAHMASHPLLLEEPEPAAPQLARAHMASHPFLLEEPEPAAPQSARAHMASHPFLLEESEPAALQHQSRPGQPGNKAGVPITSGAARSATEAQGRGRPHAHTLTTEGRALPPPRAAPAGSLGVALAPCAADLREEESQTWLAQWKWKWGV
jgi:hypothetical protein